MLYLTLWLMEPPAMSSQWPSVMSSPLAEVAPASTLIAVEPLPDHPSGLSSLPSLRWFGDCTVTALRAAMICVDIWPTGQRP